MNDYTHPQYQGLYEEILKDYQWTWGKFNPIPYPIKTQFNHEKQQQLNRK